MKALMKLMKTTTNATPRSTTRSTTRSAPKNTAVASLEPRNSGKLPQSDHAAPPSYLRNEAGMTLIEIMIVIAIIAGLMAVLGTNVMKSFNQSRVANTKISMQEVKKQLDQYNLNCGSYPSTDQGLMALVKDPGKEACPNWGEAYIKEKQLKDQWNRVFIYESDGQKVTLRSLGADGKEGGEGYNADISSDDL